MLPDYLKAIAEAAALFPPAEPRRIAEMETGLVRAGRLRERLPEDFRRFLQETDGLIWNGIEIFGTREIYRDESDYTFPSMIGVNAALAESPGLVDVLVIGRSDDDIYCWSRPAGEYQIRDRTDGAVLERFPSLVALITHLIRENG